MGVACDGFTAMALRGRERSRCSEGGGSEEIGEGNEVANTGGHGGRDG